jgi:acylphosphatase
MRRVRCVVSGRVQGVFFRSATETRMRELGVRGWVRNLADGRVEALLEGDDEAVRLGLAFLGRGPRGAVVTGVQATDELAGESLGTFEVRR